MNKDTPEIGQIVRLNATLRRSGLWLGPVWAIVCGIVASGGFKWSGASLLQALLVFLLVDVAWASLWATAAETDWATPIARWGQSNVTPACTFPYTQPNTPGDHVLRWLVHTSQWWREHLRPSTGPAVPTIILCVALAVALSAVMGWPALALTAASIAIAQLGVIIGQGRGKPLPALKATLEIGLPWLMAHIMFAPLTIPSVLLAMIFATAYGAGLTLIEGNRQTVVWNAAQFAAAGLLVLMRAPVAALAVFLMVIPQMLLEPALRVGHGSLSEDANGAWFVRSTQAWLMIAILIAAVTAS